MKINDEYVLREVAGEYVIVPVGKTIINFNGLITVNDIGKFLWENMQREFTIDLLVKEITSEYEVDIDTAKKDVEEFVNKCIDSGVIY